MNLFLDVDSKFVAGLRKDLKGTSAKKQSDLEIVQGALTLYGWAVKEAAAGRIILSTDAQGNALKRIEMSALAKR